MVKRFPVTARFSRSMRATAAAPLLAGLVLGGTAVTPARAQEPAPAPAPALPSTAVNPLAEQLPGPIRKNDVVGVMILGEPGLSATHRVSPEGTINLPLLGEVKVVSLATGKAAEIIASAYKKKNLLRHPQVIVNIAGRPDRTIFVSGALDKQGRVVLADGARLNEILEPAGVQQTSDLKRVLITRGDQKLTVDYGAYRGGSDAADTSANNPLLEDGDKIYVYANTQALVAGSVKINGEVRTPQTAGLTAGMTVVQAIQQAGGVTEHADRDQVTVVRSGQEIQVPFADILKGRQTDKDLVLQDKDEVFVRRGVPKIFRVYGGVPHASAFQLEGPVTLSDAVAMAGGPLGRVDLSQITVRRKDEAGKVQDTIYNLADAADAAQEIRAEDIIVVPYPPESKPKRDFLSVLSSVTGIATLFSIFRR